MPVAQYMSLCLSHPKQAITRPATQARRRNSGFTTAPEISQMFGELIGLWAAAAWRASGSSRTSAWSSSGPAAVP